MSPLASLRQALKLRRAVAAGRSATAAPCLSACERRGGAQPESSRRKAPKPTSSSSAGGRQARSLPEVQRSSCCPLSSASSQQLGARKSCCRHASLVTRLELALPGAPPGRATRARGGGRRQLGPAPRLAAAPRRPPRCPELLSWRGRLSSAGAAAQRAAGPPSRSQPAGARREARGLLTHLLLGSLQRRLA